MCVLSQTCFNFAGSMLADLQDGVWQKTGIPLDISLAVAAKLKIPHVDVDGYNKIMDLRKVFIMFSLNFRHLFKFRVQVLTLLLSVSHLQSKTKQKLSFGVTHTVLSTESW